MDTVCQIAQCYYNMDGRCAISHFRMVDGKLEKYPAFCPHFSEGRIKDV